jgi:16S rRNA (cytosine1402-N4)-methyltransferase
MKAGSPQGHIPVLVDEVVQFLEPNNYGFYVDGTVGLGGHAAAILQKSAPNGFLLGIDLDSEALAIAKERLREYKDRVALVGGNFAHLDRLPQLHRGSAHPETTMPQIDGILFDLGVSSLQLDTPTRGFSFTHSGPLDMRMDANRSVSAAHVVNHHSEDALATIFTQFGQERWAKRIARQIVHARKRKPISTTGQLAEIVLDAIPHKSTGWRIHPATRVFQALRIYINDELKNLHSGIHCAASALKPGGHLCIISFHSLEDRIVKEQFRTLSRACICPPKTPICVCQHTPTLQILTKRPVTPTLDEIRQNPRSRSAKLRVAMKIHESKTKD